MGSRDLMWTNASGDVVYIRGRMTLKKMRAFCREHGITEFSYKGLTIDLAAQLAPSKNDGTKYDEETGRQHQVKVSKLTADWVWVDPPEHMKHLGPVQKRKKMLGIDYMWPDKFSLMLMNEHGYLGHRLELNRPVPLLKIVWPGEYGSTAFAGLAKVPPAKSVDCG